MGVPGNAACTKGIQGRCQQSNPTSRCRAAGLRRCPWTATRRCSVRTPPLCPVVAVVAPEEGAEHGGSDITMHCGTVASACVISVEPQRETWGTWETKVAGGALSASADQGMLQTRRSGAARP